MPKFKYKSSFGDVALGERPVMVTDPRAPRTPELPLSLSGAIYSSPASTAAKANLYLELQALDGTPNKHVLFVLQQPSSV